MKNEDDIRPISHLAVGSWAQALLSPRKADQRPCHAEKARGGVKYANPRDKYILILLEYKLTLQLSGCRGSGCRGPFFTLAVNEVDLLGYASGVKVHL